MYVCPTSPTPLQTKVVPVTTFYGIISESPARYKKHQETRCFPHISPQVGLIALFCSLALPSAITRGSTSTLQPLVH